MAQPLSRFDMRHSHITHKFKYESGLDANADRDLGEGQQDTEKIVLSALLAASEPFADLHLATQIQGQDPITSIVNLAFNDRIINAEKKERTNEFKTKIFRICEPGNLHFKGREFGEKLIGSEIYKLMDSVGVDQAKHLFLHGYNGFGRIHDRDIALDAIRKKGMSLEFLSDEIRDDEEFVSMAVDNHWKALKFASDRIKNTNASNICSKAVRKSPDCCATEYVGEELKKSKDFILEAVSFTDKQAALHFADISLKEDRSFMIDAVSYAPDNILLGPITTCYKEDKDFLIEALKKNFEINQSKFDPSAQNNLNSPGSYKLHKFPTPPSNSRPARSFLGAHVAQCLKTDKGFILDFVAATPHGCLILQEIPEIDLLKDPGFMLACVTRNKNAVFFAKPQELQRELLREVYKAEAEDKNIRLKSPREKRRGSLGDRKEKTDEEIYNKLMRDIALKAIKECGSEIVRKFPDFLKLDVEIVATALLYDFYSFRHLIGIHFEKSPQALQVQILDRVVSENNLPVLDSNTLESLFYGASRTSASTARLLAMHPKLLSKILERDWLSLEFIEKLLKESSSNKMSSKSVLK